MGKTDIGVVIGRFQVHQLHQAHHDLLRAVTQNHKKVIVFIGIAPAKATRRNPLDFKSRELMLRESYPNITILPIYDTADDREWSKTLDAKIREVYAIGDVTLYGSRDGFIPHYSGEFQTVELESRHTISGSEIRKSLSLDVVGHQNFRHGVIYATYDKYPVSYTTVDAAILDEKGRVLLGSKKSDMRGCLRFIGGFVDINKDDSMESAVKREVSEETNMLGVGEPVYIGSTKIHDWRYRNEQDGIITGFYAIPYSFGKPEAKDDLDNLQWVALDDLFEDKIKVVPEHEVLVKLLKAHLNWEQKKER